MDVDALQSSAVPGLSSAASMGNSDYMTGTVALTIFFVESDGSIDPNTYTWTAQHQQDYINGVNTGLAWWTATSYNYFDCWNAFMVHYYPSTDSRCNQGYEPVLHNGTGTAPNAATWIAIIMSKFGYTTGSAYDRVYRVTMHGMRPYVSDTALEVS